jgi:hypothetical protein
MAMKQLVKGVGEGLSRERVWLVEIELLHGKSWSHLTISQETPFAITYLAAMCRVQQAPVTVLHMTDS